jgi:hypothetical protein
MATTDMDEVMIERLAAAFAPAVAAGAPREEILATIEGTSLESLGVRALCRAQDRHLLRRHEALHGPLPQAAPVGSR